MTRPESSAWPPAGGGARVSAFAVVPGRSPRKAAFMAIALMTAVWAWLSPLLAGTAIGGLARLCVTGFDVHRSGEIRITGSEDAVRAVVLVLAGVLATSIHAIAIEIKRTASRTSDKEPSDG